MHLVKIRILRDYDRLEERVRRWMDTLFEFNENAVSFRPAVDLLETSTGLMLRMELAGVPKDGLSLTLMGQELIIKGQRIPYLPDDTRRFVHHEISYGPFERSFFLPLAVDPDKIEARFRDGILEVLLPQLQAAGRRIPVKEAPPEE